MASKGRPYRARTIDGFEVLVGRGDAENDRLTFEVAAPEDFWLHAAKTPGSHVVVRNPNGLAALPVSVLRGAAALAAWHSKARGAARVEVHVCHVADVRKRRGAPAGEVILHRWRRVWAHPSDATREASPAPGAIDTPHPLSYHDGPEPGR
jgi:predicted ribosome quality control (RQC) complex YloA/Tae2 family protein